MVSWKRTIQERIQAELLSLQVDWLNDNNRDTDFNYCARHPKRFLSQIRAAIDDPSFLTTLGVSEMLKRVWIQKKNKIDKKDALVEILDIPMRALDVFEKANIKTIGELCDRTDEELMSYKCFGEKMLFWVKRRLAEIGLQLKK